MEGKVVISKNHLYFDKMCNNMAESMETEQLLEKLQTEQSFPQSIGSIGNTVPASMRRKLSQQEKRASEIYYQKLEDIWRRKIMAIHLWASHGGRRVWTIQKLFSIFSKGRWKIFLVATWKN